MKYLLMMHHAGKGPFAMMSWPKEDISRHIQFMMSVVEEAGPAGVLVAGGGPGSPGPAKGVPAGGGGRAITDGVFPESEEVPVGYRVNDVDRPGRAFQIAAE